MRGCPNSFLDDTIDCITMHFDVSGFVRLSTRLPVQARAKRDRVSTFCQSSSFQPSKKNLRSFLDKVRQCIKHHRSSSQLSLIKQLNPIISGWANCHRHVAAKKTFSKVDNFVWNCLWRWAKRRHTVKSPHWVQLVWL